MENFYSSQASSWKYTLSNRSELPRGSGWGLDKNNGNIKAWTSSSNSGYFIQDTATRITIFGKTYDFYKLKTAGPMQGFPTIYIYKNKTHLISKDISSLYIFKPEGVSGLRYAQASFSPLKSDDGYDVCLLENGYYYRVEIEQDQEIIYAEAESKSSPIKSTYQPYEPIDLNGISIKVNKYKQSISSASMGEKVLTNSIFCSNWSEIISMSDKYTSYPSACYYTENNIGDNTISATFNDTKFSWVLHVDEFENNTYICEEKINAEYNIYVGQVVDNNFLNSFQISRIKSNDFKTISTVVFSSLELDKMSNKILSWNDTYFAFNYSFNEITIPVRIDKNLHYLSREIAFANILVNKKYEVGEKINLNLINILSSGSLTYDDSTTISLNKISYLQEPYAECSLGNNEIEITENTPVQFTMSYIFQTKHFGVLKYDFTCFVQGKSDSYIDLIKLSDYKTNFQYNEVIDYGENAKLLCYNDKNVLIETIAYNDFSNRITEKDSRYGLKVNYENGFFIDESITLVSKVGIKEFRQEITFNYAESNLRLNTSNVNKLVYVNNDFVDFDYSGLIAVIYYNNNKTGLIEEIQADFNSLVFNHDPIDLSIDSKVYNINVSTTYLGQKISGYFLIQVEKIRPIRIEVIGGNDTLNYFDNDLDKFHYPNGMVFNLYWNNSITPQIINPEANLTFYRDQNYTITLTPQSIIREKDGQSIYFKHKDYENLSGFYNIKFKEDQIISLVLTNEVNIVLGNTLNYYRDDFIIKAIYESGQQINNNFKNYRFKNEDYIMNEQPIKVTCNDNEYVLDENMVTFIAPHIKEIVPDFSKFSSSYNNENDAIDATSVVLKIYYENADYVQIANVYNKNKVSANEFSIYCSDLIEYTFNGTQKINVEMPDDMVQKNIYLDFNVYNIFDINDNLNSTYSYKISILEITDITGISLVKAYQDYHVGDRFLDDFDDTEILIYYNSSSNQQRKLQIPLRSGFSAINIMPLRNTTFYKTERAKTVRITAATNEKAALEYTISVNSKYDYSSTKSRNLRAINVPNYLMPNGLILVNKYLLVEDKYTQVNNGKRTLNVNVSINDIEVFGYLDDINDKTKNARVVFFKDYIPPIAGESNIIVKYPCYVEGSSDYINKCHFGHLFGNNNAKNRLFVSGNEDYPNCDWHSGAVNSSKQEGDIINENGDFTYFEDTSYCFYGQTDNRVIGYDIISNDKMVVFKSKSDKEPTIYYRTNGLIQAIDGAGNNQLGLSRESLYEESYPLVTGNIGAGALSNKSIINFNGDTLLISSDKQLDGLDVAGILGDSQRYANTRSYYINPLLRQMNLENAQLFTNNKYLFLILEEYVLVTHFEKYDSSSRQYEWWKLDIKNISSMFEFDEKIYFGTNDGKFFVLENNTFKDITKLFIGKGGSLLASEGESDDVVTVSKEIINQLQEFDEYYFKIINLDSDDSSFMFYQICTINNVKTGNTDIYINSDLNALEIVGLSNSRPDYDRIIELRNKLSENNIYYLNHLENENDISCESKSLLGQYYRKYKLEPYLSDIIDHGELFKLIDVETGQEMNIKELYRAALCMRLDKEYLIKNINKENCSFELFNEFGKVNLVRYSNQDISKSFKAEIKKYSNVKAYYITAPFTNGNLMYDMTIWGWTLTSDTNVPSTIEVCQATNEIAFEQMIKLVDLKKTDYGHDLNNIDFSSMDFDKFTIPHKYTFYRPLRVPFICFGFKNDDGNNCVLSLMQVIYTIPNGSFGSK